MRRTQGLPSSGVTSKLVDAAVPNEPSASSGLGGGSAHPAQTARLAGLLVLAQICSMLGSAAFATTLVRLASLWHLTATSAGWISSAYFFGYTVGVPLLVALTDRVDSRLIYIISCSIGAAAGVSFAFLAHGFWSAFALHGLAGLATGGSYMPGLRLITSRLSGRTRIRAVPYYTTAFAVGTSLSFLLSGWLAGSYGWPSAFVAGSAGFVLAAGLALIATAGVPVCADLSVSSVRHPLDFRPVLRNQPAIAYVLAYGGHCWEMFAFRSWLPTYLLFSWHQVHSRSPGQTVSRWSMAIVLIGVPASILGAESANLQGRNRFIRRVEVASVAACVLSVMCVTRSFAVAIVTLFLYNIAIAADSGALTAGAVAVALAGEQGITLALYALVGFLGAGIGPLAVGAVLDLGGGFHYAHAWRLGLLAMGVGSALAALAVTFVATRQPRDREASNSVSTESLGM